MKLEHTVCMMLFTLLPLDVFGSESCREQVQTGTIKGIVQDAETKAPLMGTNVLIVGTERGAATDSAGYFIIKNVPVGSYVLRFDYIGYQQLKKPDVIVRSDRITFVHAELTMSALQGDAITVTSGYFSETEDQPVSIINFSNEEIRRAPGSAGDVSRILMSLPSIAKVNDQKNSLIVRGGSPVENGFFVDNIEIPNINHFPTQGSSGGPIGILNVDFIQAVNFYSGGFSSVYGDKLSSIIDIKFREGNRSEFDGQLDLNFAGFGGIAEGPLVNEKGSFLFSARRSYLDILVKTIDVGSTVAPSYGDYQGKLVYDLNPNHTLTFLSIWADDHNSPGREVALENDMVYYGNQDIYQQTSGVNWRALWNRNGYSNTSITYTTSRFNEDWYETNTGMYFLKNRTEKQQFKLRNLNHFRLNQDHSIEFGTDVKYMSNDYNNFYAEYDDALGNPTPAITLDKRITAHKIGLYINYIANPLNRLTTELGTRVHYFSYNDNSTFAPRFSFTYQLTHLTAINGAMGIYHQNLPLLLLSQNPKNKDLQEPIAIHYVLGLEHMITENTKLTLEVYQKDYNHFPLDPSQPGLFLLDELFYRYGFFFNHSQLVDNGKAYSRGLEVMIQKKLAKNFYGLASASYFKSRYKGYNGVWRDRVFDNRFIFSIDGGYKPNDKWEFSARWLYAGGAPYTPFDTEASKSLHRTVLEENHINEARYPDYHSLNLRFDRRFHFSGSNLVFYFSVWNAYNQKNIATYFWNDKEDKVDTIYQWGILPIFGLEYEF